MRYHHRSCCSLGAAADRSRAAGTQRLLQTARYVGAAGPDATLVESGGLLLRLQNGPLSAAVLQQQVLRKWGAFAAYRLTRPLPLLELLRVALTAEASHVDASAREAEAQALLRRLCATVPAVPPVASILADYLAIHIRDGCLHVRLLPAPPFPLLMPADAADRHRRPGAAAVWAPHARAALRASQLRRGGGLLPRAVFGARRLLCRPSGRRRTAPASRLTAHAIWRSTRGRRPRAHAGSCIRPDRPLTC